jgi:cytochrome c oxidase accessory protein FixG
MCVQVCPTGIDIRDGLQHQCIACAACVDACDTVMGQMGYHKGLIRYTTENALSGKQAKILRPRIIAYAFVLISLVVAVGVGLAGRTPLGLDVIRDRSTLFRDTDEGLVENVYTLKLINMDSKDHLYEIAVSGIDGMELSLDADQVPVAAHEVLSVSARVRADPYSLERASSTIVFTLQAIDDDSLRVDEEARFLGPVSPAR